MTKVQLVDKNYLPQEESLHVICYAGIGFEGGLGTEVKERLGISDKEYESFCAKVNDDFTIETHKDYPLTLLPHRLVNDSTLKKSLPVVSIIKLMLELWVLRKQYKEKNLLLILSNMWNADITLLHQELAEGKGFQIRGVKNLYIWTTK